MPTDDERRRVAERLRGISRDVRFWGGVDPLHYIKKGVFGDVDRHDPNETIDRLADLIEPSDTLSQQCRDNDACDRDALLELACEFEKQGDLIARSIEDSEGCFYQCDIDAMKKRYGWARRIREACGVVE